MDASQIEKLTTEATRLCTWLRANSSGVYRPAAEAATVIEELIAEVERLRAALAAGTVEKDADQCVWLPDLHECIEFNGHGDVAIEAQTKAGKESA